MAVKSVFATILISHGQQNVALWIKKKTKKSSKSNWKLISPQYNQEISFHLISCFFGGFFGQKSNFVDYDWFVKAIKMAQHSRGEYFIGTLYFWHGVNKIV